METYAVDLENSGKETDDGFLRQKVSHILNRKLIHKGLKTIKCVRLMRVQG